jgi:hypothetical protein
MRAVRGSLGLVGLLRMPWLVGELPTLVRALVERQPRVDRAYLERRRQVR